MQKKIPIILAFLLVFATTSNRLFCMEPLSEISEIRKQCTAIKLPQTLKRLFREKRNNHQPDPVIDIGPETAAAKPRNIFITASGNPHPDSIKEMAATLLFKEQNEPTGYNSGNIRVTWPSDERGTASRIFEVSFGGKAELFFKVYKADCSKRLFYRMQRFSQGPLARLQYNALFKKCILDQSLMPFLPHFVLTECFFTYFDAPCTKRFIEVTHAAPGEKLFNILCSENPLDQKKMIFAQVGRSLGALHRHFMTNDKTLLHGDFNLTNIFINSKDTWIIDSESSAECLTQPQLIDWDIEAFIFIPLFYWLKVIYPNHWKDFVNLCTDFLQGYVSTYPEAKQQDIIIYIKTIIARWFDEAITLVSEMQDDVSLKKILTRTTISEKAEPLFTVVHPDEESIYNDAGKGIWEGFINQFYTYNEHKDTVCLKEIDYAQLKIDLINAQNTILFFDLFE